jgi:ketosteroid isomerase-like protein
VPPDFDPDAFLRDYAAAFAAGEATAVANFYDVPCLTMRADETVRVFPDRRELETFFRKVISAYLGDGMASFDSSPPDLAPMGVGCCGLTCDWNMRRADASVIRAWRQTYLLRRGEAEWRVIASIFHR